MWFLNFIIDIALYILLFMAWRKYFKKRRGLFVLLMVILTFGLIFLSFLFVKLQV